VVVTVGFVVWIVQLRSDIDLVTKRQNEVIVRLGSIDEGGTRANGLLRQRVDQIGVEVSSQSIRCKEVNQAVDALSKETYRNGIMIQNIIEAINPHPPIVPAPKSK
jgi:hypothetical protein